MELQTIIKIPPLKKPIGYESQVFLWGSCFSDHIARKLELGQFQTKANPFGIIFNPLALASIIERIACQQAFTASDIFESNGLWHSYYFHSKYSKNSPQSLLEWANNQLQESYDYFKKSSHVMITLGTAWGYVLQGSFVEKDQLNEAPFWVANCHKQPAHFFNKQLANSAQIEAALRKIHHLISLLNPSAHIVFTLSPVRHLKDGFVENNRSKALLLTGIHNCLDSAAVLSKDSNGESTLSYFPSYEIQMDELRDYRFYKEDLLHPSDTAIQYIWERFIACAMEISTAKTLAAVQKIQASLSHKPFHSETPAYQAFKNNLAEKIKDLQLLYPWMFKD